MSAWQPLMGKHYFGTLASCHGGEVTRAGDCRCDRCEWVDHDRVSVRLLLPSGRIEHLDHARPESFR